MSLRDRLTRGQQPDQLNLTGQQTDIIPVLTSGQRPTDLPKNMIGQIYAGNGGEIDLSPPVILITPTKPEVEGGVAPAGQRLVEALINGATNPNTAGTIEHITAIVHERNGSELLTKGLLVSDDRIFRIDTQANVAPYIKGSMTGADRAALINGIIPTCAQAEKDGNVEQVLQLTNLIESSYRPRPRTQQSGERQAPEPVDNASIWGKTLSTSVIDSPQVITFMKVFAEYWNLFQDPSQIPHLTTAELRQMRNIGYGQPTAPFSIVQESLAVQQRIEAAAAYFENVKFKREVQAEDAPPPQNPEVDKLLEFAGFMNLIQNSARNLYDRRAIRNEKILNPDGMKGLAQAEAEYAKAVAEKAPEAQKRAQRIMLQVVTQMYTELNRPEPGQFPAALRQIEDTLYQVDQASPPTAAPELIVNQTAQACVAGLASNRIDPDWIVGSALGKLNIDLSKLTAEGEPPIAPTLADTRLRRVLRETTAARIADLNERKKIVAETPLIPYQDYVYVPEEHQKLEQELIQLAASQQIGVDVLVNRLSGRVQNPLPLDKDSIPLLIRNIQASIKNTAELANRAEKLEEQQRYSNTQGYQNQAQLYLFGKSQVLECTTEPLVRQVDAAIEDLGNLAVILDFSQTVMDSTSLTRLTTNVETLMQLPLAQIEAQLAGINPGKWVMAAEVFQQVLDYRSKASPSAIPMPEVLTAHQADFDKITTWAQKQPQPLIYNADPLVFSNTIRAAYPLHIWQNLADPTRPVTAEVFADAAQNISNNKPTLLIEAVRQFQARQATERLYESAEPTTREQTSAIVASVLDALTVAPSQLTNFQAFMTRLNNGRFTPQQIIDQTLTFAEGQQLAAPLKTYNRGVMPENARDLLLIGAAANDIVTSYNLFDPLDQSPLSKAFNGRDPYRKQLNPQTEMVLPLEDQFFNATTAAPAIEILGYNARSAQRATRPEEMISPDFKPGIVIPSIQEVDTELRIFDPEQRSNLLRLAAYTMATAAQTDLANHPVRRLIRGREPMPNAKGTILILGERGTGKSDGTDAMAKPFEDKGIDVSVAVGNILTPRVWTGKQGVGDVIAWEQEQRYARTTSHYSQGRVSFEDAAQSISTRRGTPAWYNDMRGQYLPGLLLVDEYSRALLGNSVDDRGQEDPYRATLPEWYQFLSNPGILNVSPKDEAGFRSGSIPINTIGTAYAMIGTVDNYMNELLASITQMEKNLGARTRTDLIGNREAQAHVLQQNIGPDWHLRFTTDLLLTHGLPPEFVDRIAGDIIMFVKDNQVIQQTIQKNMETDNRRNPLRVPAEVLSHVTQEPVVVTEGGLDAFFEYSLEHSPLSGIGYRHFYNSMASRLLQNAIITGENEWTEQNITRLLEERPRVGVQYQEA